MNDPWIDLLKKCPKARTQLFRSARRLMKTLASKKRYPDVATIRGLLKLSQS